MIFPTQSLGNQSEFSESNTFSDIGIKSAENTLPDFSDLSIFHLDVKLYEEDAIVDGNFSIKYHNNDDIAMDAIPFHLYLFGMRYQYRAGNITIQEVRDDENPGSLLDFTVLVEDQVLWVNLSQTINTGEWANFTIQFSSIMPDGGIDRCNVHGADISESKIFKYAVAYPMPCVYDDVDEWNLDSYLTVGDPFYSDMAYHTMNVTVPTGMVVAGTGELVDKINLGNDTIHVFDPELPTRETTFAASHYFLQESSMYEGTNLSIFYLPDSYDVWHENSLTIVEDSVALYSEIGTYPYPTLNVVEEYTAYGGMEHPLQVYISNVYSDPGSEHWQSVVIAHEVGHQWFYHLVGNDEVDAGHLDEGLVCWLEDWYQDSINLEVDLFSHYTLRDTVVQTQFTKGVMEDSVNTSILDYVVPNDYWFNSYSKAPVILEKLRKTIGNDQYMAGLSLFFDRFQFKIAWFPDLQEAFEDVVGESLDWFFQPWFENANLPKYYFRDYSYDANSEQISITIYDAHETYHQYTYNQEIKLIFRDKNNELLHSKLYWINGTTTLEIPNISSVPDKLIIPQDNEAIFHIYSQGTMELSFTLLDTNNDNDDDGKIAAFPIIGFLAISVVSCLVIFHQTIKRKKEKSYF